MPIYNYNCSICLKVEQSGGSTLKTLQTQWKIFNDKLWTLPPGLRLMECQGCGSLGIKLINSKNAQV